jgi:hypothetical protein
MAGDFQVFISYARKDNESPKDDPSLKGFVTFLHERLTDELTDLGGASVRLWRDTRNISDVDQFEPVLEKEIVGSSIMLVVMSPNWLASPYCQAEVARFAKRWLGEGAEAVKTRIKVVRKRPNGRNLWPPWLQGQVGLAFFADEQSDENGLEDGFFWRGKVRDETYHKRVRELAGVLSREAARGGKQIPRIDSPVSAPATARTPSAGRTIFVAKPATDMRVAYDRVVHELAGRGYVVVPEGDIPPDETAVEFIDKAMSAADLSVHLLGVKAGYAPQDVAPIVKLQLERAIKRAGADAPSAVPSASGAQGGDKYRFRRILWAPKILDADSVLVPGAGERDPLAVVATFSKQLPTDKIDGQGLSKFIDFLVQTLAVDETPLPTAAPVQGAAPKVYLYHEREDSAFAVQVATALSARQVEPLICITEGPPQDVRALHRRRLAECDAVALCWATTPEIKLSAKSNELKNWRQLKRAKQFAYRGLVVGPPPNQDKKNSKFHFSKDEIDVQLDLSEPQGDIGELIDKLVPRVIPDAP